MGCGKSTIGRQLAKRLHYHFIDTDRQIELEMHLSVAEIFRQTGESYFRQLETKLLHRLLRTKNTVISTGGGMVTTEGNWELIHQLGMSLFLDVSVPALVERVSRNQHRPMLTQSGESTQQRVESLLLQRLPIYQQAQKTLKTDGYSPGQVVSLILQLL